MKTRLLVFVTGMLSFLAIAQFAAADRIETANDRHPEFDRHWHHDFQSSANMSIDIESPGSSCSTGHNNNCLNGQPWSLDSILSGHTAFDTGMIGNGGSWRVVNDTGSTITDLVLYFDGSLASTANLTIGVDGWNAILNPFSNCQITTATAVVSSGNCSVSSANHPNGPDQLVWSVGTNPGLAPGQIFNIQILSFSHVGQDIGCISGTANCRPVKVTATPEPGTLALLGTGMLGMVSLLRRKVFKAPGFGRGAAVDGQ